MSYYLYSLLSAVSVATGAISNDPAPTPAQPAVVYIASETPTDPAQLQLNSTREKVGKLAHQDLTVMKNYDLLIGSINTAYMQEKTLNAQDVIVICTAIEFIAEKHQFQTRKNPQKTPYVSHLLGVAYNVMSLGNVRDPNVIVAALLHDVVEDTSTSLNEVQEQFGPQVASLVKEVTDDKSLPSEARKQHQIESAADASEGAAQIKLADSLYNLRDLSAGTPVGWSQARVDHYYEWTQAKVSMLPKVDGELYLAVQAEISTHESIRKVKHSAF
jgi:guanosine-3',5'-bis(diphosphate) 3'-pyrophosphohydrolase